MTEDGVVLVWAKDSGTGSNVVLTQHDVREVQLVKAAIYAGIVTLLEKMGRTRTSWTACSSPAPSAPISPKSTRWPSVSSPISP